VIDYRLIQNDRGDVYRFEGEATPDGWKWYTEPVRGRVVISGTYTELKQAAPVVEKTETGECKVPCAVISRVVGYLTDTRYWNKGKRQEWAERRPYRIEGEHERD